MTATATKEPEIKKKEPFAEGVEWISESVDLNTIFRVKGKSGIWVPITRPNRGGMLGMRRWMTDETITTHKSNLQTMNGAVIFKKKGKTITILEAFDNLQKHFNNNITGEIHTEDQEKIMEIICPKYDPRKFRDYHAKRIIEWYNQIVYTINQTSGENN